MSHDRDNELIRDVIEEAGERRLVYRASRRDQLFVLSKNGVLNQVEFDAGRRLQSLREKATVGPLRAQTMDQVFQDKDQRRAPKDAAGDALRHFQRVLTIKERMNPTRWRIVCMICFGQATYGEIVTALGRGSTRRIGPMVRKAFEELANIIHLA